MTSLVDFQQPDFLFCEINPKTGSYDDNRIWIYHLPSKSLIEFIPVKDIINLNLQIHGIQKNYVYQVNEGLDNHFFRAVLIQDNCKDAKFDHAVVMYTAWKYLKSHLKSILNKKKIDI